MPNWDGSLSATCCKHLRLAIEFDRREDNAVEFTMPPYMQRRTGGATRGNGGLQIRDDGEQ